MKDFEQGEPVALVRSSQLIGCRLHATDDELGKIKDLYFDDRHWGVRYLAADTENWLRGRQVLLSPQSVARVDVDEGEVHVNLTRERVEKSPGLELDRPVSRQYEVDLAGYYGWAPYWGVLGYPVGTAVPPAEPAKSAAGHKGDPNLRSAREVEHYHINADDGDIGHVEEFVVEPGSWTIRYMVVDTRNWWPGKNVLISPEWISEISWEQAKVHVRLTREQVKQSPEFEHDRPITRAYEEDLYRHYGYSGYWGV